MSLTATNLIEAYEFTGSFTTYRYTTADRQITVDGQTFSPAAIARGAVSAGDQTQEGLELEVTLPFTLDVVQDYAFQTSPPSLVLRLLAFDRSVQNPVNSDIYASSNGAVLWSGQVAGFSVTNRNARLRVPSNFTRALQTTAPAIFYQNPCNHVLYGPQCKVNPTGFTQTTTVTSVATTTIGVTSDGFANNFLDAGSIRNDRTNERRLIISNIDDSITINVPFVDLLVGDTVVMRAGCDHSFTTCRVKFNNTINYGGQPFIPGRNPFFGQL